jgi:hypothetical protein
MQLQTGNLFSFEAKRGDEEQVDMLITGQRLNVERIVSMGHASPEGFWYDDSRAEWVVLLSGRGRDRVRRGLDAARHASRRLRADRAALPASRCVDACQRANRLAYDLSRTLNRAPIHTPHLTIVDRRPPDRG